jgi:acyl carrier protein
MKEEIYAQVKALLADYIDVPVMELNMDADLDMVYEMDSTELTEFAKEIDNRFGVAASRSDRQSWETGNAICEFVLAKKAETCEAA